VLARIAEGSVMDRSISFVSVLTTSVPEFASATFLLAIFVFWLGWLPGTSSGAGSLFRKELILPVAVLVTFNFGYYTRMMRASMAEVMNSQYVRTAVLKGMPFQRVVMKHALRNALIAPFTVMVLQINYLLSGVIVTEVIFAYDGFGRRLYEAAQVRAGDLVQLERIAASFKTRESFLTEMALDPPSATSDLSGAPYLDEDYLVLSTIHSAKGQEWDAVFLLNVADDNFPSEFSTGRPELIEEERRLLYVAMTRAKTDLHLIAPLKKYVRQQSRMGDRHV
jgi:hypothetical protein